MNQDIKRLNVAAGQTYELPHETRQVRMLSGEAWVSLGLAVYVTPLGRKNIEMVIATETSS